jgi:murein DD-endopeptidase MepM/ murein hydrolase activator NlpD
MVFFAEGRWAGRSRALAVTAFAAAALAGIVIPARAQHPPTAAVTGDRDPASARHPPLPPLGVANAAAIVNGGASLPAQTRPAGAVLSVPLATKRTARAPSPPSGGQPFALCPVQGQVHGWDDFGQPRYAGGFHLHQGIDIMAAEGTPIVAPFAGTAVATPNLLGGDAVKVYGPAGYVYNAHLSRYGMVGRVESGTVIGFVGTTGDARGGPSHDHFEWHPGNGPAVDPFLYLVGVCG